MATPTGSQCRIFEDLFDLGEIAELVLGFDLVKLDFDRLLLRLSTVVGLGRTDHCKEQRQKSNRYSCSGSGHNTASSPVVTYQRLTLSPVSDFR